MKNNWFRFHNSFTDPSVADIYILDFIGDSLDQAFGLGGTTPRAFVEELSKIPDAVKTIRVHINSPGGDVQGGINIANALREQASKGRTVETIVDGIAASIASVIAMAGQTITMADNALMMIHDPYMLVLGNATELRNQANVLDTIRTQIINTYKWHSPLSPNDIAALMTQETWMTADEAIAKGFATNKVEGLRAAAMTRTPFDPRGLAALKFQVPARFKNTLPASLVAASAACDSVDILRLCEAASLPIAFVSALAAQRPTAAEVHAQIDRAKTVRAMCQRTRVSPGITQVLLKNHTMDLSDVRALLVDVTAAMDSVEIDSTLMPDGPRRSRKGSSNPNVIYVAPTNRGAMS